jgi:hypothetical protein
MIFAYIITFKYIAYILLSSGNMISSRMTCLPTVYSFILFYSAIVFLYYKIMKKVVKVSK